jgi:Outer membrane protein beta-barrel domain
MRFISQICTFVERIFFMKKAIVAFLLFSFFVFEAPAQKFGWGLNAGVSLSTVTGTYPKGGTITNAEVIPGFLLGTFVKFRPRRFFSLSTGINYISKGANIDSNTKVTGMGTKAAKLRTVYFEVPVLVQLNFSPYSPNRPNIFFGPSFSWLLTAKDNFTIDYYGPPPPPMVEVGKYYKSFDPGFIIGAGIDVDVSDWKIFSAGIRYTYALNNIANPELGEFVAEEFELKNVNISLFMSLTFVMPTYSMNGTGKKKRDTKFKGTKIKKGSR